MVGNACTVCTCACYIQSMHVHAHPIATVHVQGTLQKNSRFVYSQCMQCSSQLTKEQKLLSRKLTHMKNVHLCLSHHTTFVFVFLRIVFSHVILFLNICYKNFHNWSPVFIQLEKLQSDTIAKYFHQRWKNRF